MTITGIDSTGQSSGGNVLPPRRATDAEDLEAELLSFESDVAADLPISVVPEVLPEVVPGAAPLPEQGAEPARRVRWWRSLTWRDVLAIVSFIGVTLYITSSVWLHLDHVMRHDPQDQAFFETMLAHGARVLTHGGNPFFTDRINYPDGVNLMANTSVLAVSLPLTPITLLFGPHVAFNVFLTLALALTATSWYLVLSRKFVTSRLAAWIGALFCGFAPSMAAHANGHPNIVCQFLVPVILWRTLELRRPGRSIRNGLILGGLLVWQAFINLEILFMTAVGLGIFCLVMGIARHRSHPGETVAFLRGVTVAVSTALVALAYPLYVQFFGPQSYHGLPLAVRQMGSDLAAFTTYSGHSLAGNTAIARALSTNNTEQNAFFGWGMVVLFFGLIVWMRRRLSVLVLGGIALLYAAMSLGPTITYNGKSTGVAGMWNVLQHVPVLDSAVPTRWAMAITPVAGLVLAFGIQRAVDLIREQPASRGPIRIGMITAVAMALVPIIPLPVSTRPMNPIPQFVTAGLWKQYVDDNHTVVTLPLPSSAYTDPMRWSAMTGLDMRIAGAYALLPGQNTLDPSDNTASFSPAWRPTSGLVDSILLGNPVPEITDTRREMTLADLRYWRAGVIVMVPQAHDMEILRAISSLLNFQPVWKGGVWMWDVRKLVDNPNAVLTGPDEN